MNEILETTKYIVDNSNDVLINHDALFKTSAEFKEHKMSHWLEDSPVDFKSFTDKQKLNFVLVFSAISFSYWGNPKWTVEYEGKQIDGSYGLMTALNRALNEGVPVLDLKYLATLKKEDFEHILRANTPIPLLEERLKILNEIGSVLTQKYNGDFTSLIKKGNKDVNLLRRLIASEIPSFEDSVEYKGKKIYFHKRAQVLISDIYQLFNGQSFGEFKNPNELTAGADYKLPQILRKFGVLKYSKNLAEKIDNKIPLDVGSGEETEIRANTIWAVELMREKLKKHGRDLSSMTINDCLWVLTQTKQADDKPYHLVRTIAY